MTLQLFYPKMTSYSFPLAAIRFRRVDNNSIDLELCREEFGVRIADTTTVIVPLTKNEKNKLELGVNYTVEIDHGFVEAEFSSCKLFIKENNQDGAHFCFRSPDFEATRGSLVISPSHETATFTFNDLPFDIQKNPDSSDGLTLTSDETTPTLSITIPNNDITVDESGGIVTVTALHADIARITDASVKFFLETPSEFFQGNGECGGLIFNTDFKVSTCEDDPITVTEPLTQSGTIRRSVYNREDPSFDIAFSASISDFDDPVSPGITISGDGDTAPTYTATVNNGNVHIRFPSPSKGVEYTLTVSKNSVKTNDASLCDPVAGHKGPDEDNEYTFCVFDPLTLSFNPPITGAGFYRMTQSEFEAVSNTFTIDGNYDIDRRPSRINVRVLVSSNGNVAAFSRSLSTADPQDRDVLVTMNNVIFGRNYTLRILQNAIRTRSGTCGRFLRAPTANITQLFCVHKDSFSVVDIQLETNSSTRELEAISILFVDIRRVRKIPDDVSGVIITDTTTNGNRSLSITEVTYNFTRPNTTFTAATTLDVNSNGDVKYYLNVLVEQTKFRFWECRIRINNEAKSSKLCYNIPFNTVDIEDDDKGIEFIDDYDGTFLINSTDGYNIGSFDSSALSITYGSSMSLDDENYFAEVFNGSISITLPITNITIGTTYTIELDVDGASSILEQSCSCTIGVPGPITRFNETFCVFEIPLINENETKPADFGQSGSGNIELCIVITGLSPSQTLLKGHVGELDYGPVNGRNDTIIGPTTLEITTNGQLTLNSDERKVCANINVDANKHYKVLVKNDFVKVENCDNDYNSTEHFFIFCTHRLTCKGTPSLISKIGSNNLGVFFMSCNHEVKQAPGQKEVYFGSKSNGKEVKTNRERNPGKSIKMQLKTEETMSALVDSGETIQIPKGFFWYHRDDLCIVENEEFEISLEAEEVNDNTSPTTSPSPAPQVPIDPNGSAATQQPSERVISITGDANNGDNIQKDPVLGSNTVIASNNLETEQLLSGNSDDGGRALGIPNNEVSNEPSPIMIDSNAAGVLQSISSSGITRQNPLLANQPGRSQASGIRGREESYSRGNTLGSQMPSSADFLRPEIESIGDRSQQPRFGQAGLTSHNLLFQENSLSRPIPFEDRRFQPHYHERAIPNGRALQQLSVISNHLPMHQTFGGPFEGMSAARRVSDISSRFSTFNRKRRDIDSTSFVHPLVRGMRESKQQLGKDIANEAVG